MHGRESRVEQVADTTPNVRRRATHLPPNDVADLSNHRPEPKQGVAVVGGEACKLARSRGIVVDRQRFAVRQRQEIGLRSGHEAQPVELETQIANDFRGEHAHGVARRGVAKTGVKFFRHGRAADDGAAFQHPHGQARLGQVAGTDQTVVATADDDDVGWV